MGAPVSMDWSREAIGVVAPSRVAELQGRELVSLNLSNQPHFSSETLQTVGTLTSLRTLSISGLCVSQLDPLTSLQGLQALNVSNANQLQSLAPLRALTNLTELNISGCAKLKNDALTAIQNIQLQSLTMQNCASMTSNGLNAMPTTLTSLDISNNFHFNKPKVQEFASKNPQISLKK